MKYIRLNSRNPKEEHGSLSDIIFDGHPETMLLVNSRAERNVLVDGLRKNGWRITRFYRDLMLAEKSGSKNLYVGMDGNRPEKGESR